jgi:phytoene dehydrogenase-like protein
MTEELFIQPDDVLLLHKTHFNMTNQPPDQHQIDRIERLREHYKQAASMIYVNCPKSRERSLALTGLEESLMWAVASIAREKWSVDDEG